MADRYVIDGRIVTAGGASPAFDLILHLIRSRFGAAVALDVASVFIYDEAHAATDAQPLVSLGRLGAQRAAGGGGDPADGGVARPAAGECRDRAAGRGLGADARDCCSARALGVGPAAYGVQLRLQAARRMVTDTDLPLREIAVRTGFASASSFAHSFRRHAGRSAGDLRRAARMSPPG